MKVCVIIVHLGSLPAWFAAWLATAKANPTIDFHLFSDVDPGPLAKNVFRHEMTLEGFNRLETVTGLGLQLSYPYKVCDFRPLFGRIFPDLVAPYNYWGWGDLDVLYGDIQNCLSGSFGIFDYIATGWNGESGPLGFLRNSDTINSLFEKIPDWRSRLNNSKYVGVDEIDIIHLLKLNFRCDMNFRECLYDLPARLQDGSLIGVYSRREYVLYHFGGRQTWARKSVSRRVALLAPRLETGACVYIGRRGTVRPGFGRFYFMIDKIARRLGIF